jgi:dTDP-4-dehydrorhamnose reductase
MEAQGSQVRLLVTGASGLLGTRLCEVAVKNHEIYSVYSQRPPVYGAPFKIDIADEKAYEKIFRKLRPEAVVHAAALTDVDKCEVEKELAWKTNVQGTANIARLCCIHSAFLVYVSTDYVFNGKKGTYKETDKPGPINYYGLTKLEGEKIVEKSEVECCIARTSVLYGTVPSSEKTNFALWLLDKLKRKEEAKIVMDQWNSPTLNTNLAGMILEILERKIGGTFHLAGATRLSRYEFAKSVAKAFDLDMNLIVPVSSGAIPWIAKRPRDSSLNVDKAQETLRNHRPMQIHEALEKMKKESG